MIVKHVNLDGRSKAKAYIQKLANKNKGKTDALNDFIVNSASYFVPQQFLQEYNTTKNNNMKRNKIRLTESHLKKIISETVNQILEYNDEWLKNVDDCNFLSDEDKKSIQIASMNNWDRHEREEKKKQDMDKLERLSNKNIYNRKMFGESFNSGNQEDIMDVIIRLKEAYFDIQKFTKQNRTAGLDLSEAMGNIRGAIKILNKRIIK